MENILAIIMLTITLAFFVYMAITSIKEYRKVKQNHQAIIDRLEELKYFCEDCGQTEDANALDYAINILKRG